MQCSDPIKLENYESLPCPPLHALPPCTKDLAFSYWSMPCSSTQSLDAFQSPYFSPPPLAMTLPTAAEPSMPCSVSFENRRTGTQVPMLSRSGQNTSQYVPTTALHFDLSPLTPARPRVPRPPNAFMLFRSDFLKRGVIPSSVECRQQNLSRIAGQCWNLLPVEEKTKWQERATKVLLEHQKRNPDYKFTPSPRGSRRSKAIGRPEVEAEGEDRIRKIREAYTQLTGPALAPARRRRHKAQNRSCDVPKKHDHQLAPRKTQTFPHSVPPSSSQWKEPPLPPFFPQHSFPHVITPRRPSTSQGFSTTSTSHNAIPVNSSRSLTRPPSAASSETGLTAGLQDLDITPTTAQLDNILPPVSPSSSVAVSHVDLVNVRTALRDIVPFRTLNSASPAVLQPPSPPNEELTEAREPACASVEWFFDSTYSSDSFAFLMDSPLHQEGCHESSRYKDTIRSTFYPLDHPPAQAWDLRHSLTEVIDNYVL